MSETTTSLPTLNAKDFASDQDVRWCPGCGDYAVLATVRKTLPKLKHLKEDYVFISGIGCAARFPYYMNTYGMHSIHGRALSIATGVKLANPDLQVVVVCGDGDLLSIGGNHTIHTMRRNVDITTILLNNKIYGLTKGQYSPTSEIGKVTKSTPMGSLDFPLNPLAIVIGAGSTFVARTIDIDGKALGAILERAIEHKGASFVEVYQNCNIFNHQAWFYATQKDSKADATVVLEHGKPLIFGKDREKGIRLVGTRLEVVELNNGVTEDDLVIHDEADRGLAFMLTQMTYPEFPEPMGVLYVDADRPTYEQLVHDQVATAIEKKGPGNLHDLIRGSETWEVTE